MALVRKQRDLSKGHPQARMIKEEPSMEKRQQPRFTSQFRSIISGGQGEGQGRTLDLYRWLYDRNGSAGWRRGFI